MATLMAKRLHNKAIGVTQADVRSAEAMARRRQRSIDDAEAQKELRLQGKVVPTLDPIDSSLLSGPSDLHLTDNEIEVQHRWAKLEELKKDQEARRVRTKQDVLDDTNDAVTVTTALSKTFTTVTTIP